MSTIKETLELALEALKVSVPVFLEDFSRHSKATTALQEALASEALEQPSGGASLAQQEPVVWMYVNKSTHETKFQKHMSDFVDHRLWSEAPLYGEPLANHELQCVCGAVWCGDEMVHLPDKRPPASKPLTSQERDAKRWRFLMENSYDSESVTQFHVWEHSWEPHSKTGKPTEWKQRVRGIALIDFIDRAIEAKLREKNGITKEQT